MSEFPWMPAFVCPQCAVSLTASTSGVLSCVKCRTAVPLRDGIYRFLRPERQAEIQPLLAQYRRVREEDGYRQAGAAYYQSLPTVDARDPQAATWQVRRESFRNLGRLLRRFGHGGLRVLDLGAGNGWLSARMAARGHRCVAVDWLDDVEDGLGARRHYPAAFTCVQADFDDLPLASGQFDIAIFNASLHYSPDPGRTVRHALKTLVAGGALVVMDSPVFATDAAGRRMLAGQQRGYRARCGTVVRWGVGYLTDGSLTGAGRDAGGAVRWIPSRGGPSWAIRRWVAGLKERREPARFGVWHAVWRPVSS